MYLTSVEIFKKFSLQTFFRWNHLKRDLKFSSLGKRQANKVFVPSVVVMDLLRGVEVI